MSEILQQLVGIDYADLSKAERNILRILEKNGIDWHYDEYGTVRAGKQVHLMESATK
jgi:hypothetical protein